MTEGIGGGRLGQAFAWPRQLSLLPYNDSGLRCSAGCRVMSLTRIERAFNDRFSRIPVVIPHKAFQGNAPGTIYFKGWTFHYVFHKHNGKDCLIVFESHPIAWAFLHRVEINGLR